MSSREKKKLHYLLVPLLKILNSILEESLFCKIWVSEMTIWPHLRHYVWEEKESIKQKDEIFSPPSYYHHQKKNNIAFIILWSLIDKDANKLMAVYFVIW